MNFASSLNPILLTDSYKTGHGAMYPPGVTRVGSHLVARVPRERSVLVVGLRPVFQRIANLRVTAEHVDSAERLVRAHGGHFNRAGWEHVVARHGGCLPVEIRAVEEGTLLPGGTPIATICNTDDEVPWVTNYVESVLMHAWYPITVATAALEQRRVVAAALAETGGNAADAKGKLVDFGLRGVSSVESAVAGGMAHLAVFNSSDNLPAIAAVPSFYDLAEASAGFSVPAAEHSTVSAWGEAREEEAYRHIVTAAFPSGPVSVVSDTWDLHAAVEGIWGGTLRDAVLARDGTVVIRPDSGEPLPNLLRVMDTLKARFGGTATRTGHWLLPPQVRVIQGDGISPESLPLIVRGLVDAGWAMDNFVFGSGGALLQKWNRDTLGFAIKCNYVVRDGVVQHVRKNPKTDPSKASIGGPIALLKDFSVVASASDADNLLKLTVRNGNFTTPQDSFEAIRARVDAHLTPP